MGDDTVMSEPAPPVLGSLTQHESLRARVTSTLREAMVAGELVPGSIHSAPALARTLGVSATPVREAMLELTREGLVETLPHRGYRIVEIDDTVLDELVDLRELIEVPTVGRVADRATAAEIAALRPAADRLEDTAERGLLQEFIGADMEFHLGLLAIAGNTRLVEEVRRLRSLSRLPGLRSSHGRGELLRTAREHHQLLDLIQAGDRPGAEQLMREHLRHIRGEWAGRPES